MTPLRLSGSVATAERACLIPKSPAELAGLVGGDVDSVVRLSVASLLAALSVAIIPSERGAPPSREGFTFSRTNRGALDED